MTSVLLQLHDKLQLTFLKAMTSRMLVNSMIIPRTNENKANTISMLRTEEASSSTKKEKNIRIFLNKIIFNGFAYHVCCQRKQIRMKLCNSRNVWSREQPWPSSRCQRWPKQP